MKQLNEESNLMTNIQNLQFSLSVISHHFHFLEKIIKLLINCEALEIMKFEDFIPPEILNILILIEFFKILTNLNYFLLREHN